MNSRELYTIFGALRTSEEVDVNYESLLEADTTTVTTEDESPQKIAEGEINRLKGEINRLKMDLENLKTQIDRIKKLSVDSAEKKALHDKFTMRLEWFYDEIKHDTKKQIGEIKAILDSYQWTSEGFEYRMKAFRTKSVMTLVRNEVTPTLKKLEFTPDSQKQDIAGLNQLNTICAEQCQKDEWKNFGKAIAAICWAGLCAIIGATVGFFLGALVGTAPGALTGATLGGAVGAASGYLSARNLTKIPEGAFGHFLTFRKPQYSAAKDMAQAGIEVVSTAKRNI